MSFVRFLAINSKRVFVMSSKRETETRYWDQDWTNGHHSSQKPSLYLSPAVLDFRRVLLTIVLPKKIKLSTLKVTNFKI